MNKVLCRIYWADFCSGILKLLVIGWGGGGFRKKIKQIKKDKTGRQKNLEKKLKKTGKIVKR